MLSQAHSGYAHTPEASSRRRRGNVTQRAERAAWDSDHNGEDHDPAHYFSEIAPKLRELTITTIARATGTSTSSDSKLRSGQRVPHSFTSKGPAETFTGDVWVDPITRGLPPTHLNVAAVRFSPGARSAWHSHDGGQTLLRH